ncbi:transposable element Tcb2 transposase [Trichonephila clavipes]|nr:transposable element Tcb2 transposase [Trichonephila clavipes]
MQGDQLRVHLSTDDREGPAYLGQENTFSRTDRDKFLYSLQTSSDLHWRAIEDLIWRERSTKYHQSNTVERHRGNSDCCEILDPYARPYAGAIGNDFILMDDNARPPRAVIVEGYLKDLGLERIE